MDLAWMTQSFQAVLSLCFGSDSHSSIFLKDWTNHIYGNRLIDSSIYASDPCFYAKNLFTIDNALQIHWRSCSSSSDHISMSNRILRMTDIQDFILHLSFNQMLPKSISHKIQSQQDNNNKDGKLNNGGKFPGKKGKTDKLKDLVYDNNKNHSHWRLKDNKYFSRVFSKNQRECPQTSDGKNICMKFFLRGLCNKSCTRSYSLSKEDENKFEVFINNCRDGASKPDFLTRGDKLQVSLLPPLQTKHLQQKPDISTPLKCPIDENGRLQLPKKLKQTILLSHSTLTSIYQAIL